MCLNGENEDDDYWKIKMFENKFKKFMEVFLVSYV